MKTHYKIQYGCSIVFIILGLIGLFTKQTGMERYWVGMSILWCFNALMTNAICERSEKDLKELKQETRKYLFTSEDIANAKREGSLEERLKQK